MNRNFIIKEIKTGVSYTVLDIIGADDGAVTFVCKENPTNMIVTFENDDDSFEFIKWCEK